ncbi:MAG: TIM-barrel domain-containing protein [Planctomycetota bacterium]
MIERLTDGVFRFWPGSVKPDRPSLALQGRIEGEAVGSAGPRVPSIAFEQGRASWSAIVEGFDAAECHLYGTGEAPGSLERSGRRTVCWNTDAPAYGEQDRALYQSHPWVLGVRADGSAFGVLADTTFKCLIDLRGTIAFRARGGPFPVIVIDADDPRGVLERLAGLTGTIDLPAKWTLGYHQCRWSYGTADRVREIARGFRDRHIPCDAIWMDIDYMDRYRVFTFDRERFPDPKTLNDELHADGFHAVWMIDCGVAAEESYHAFETGTEADAWVTTADGNPAAGPVWPERCVFPDFTSPAVRGWWRGLYKDFLAHGIDGVWNDMNEPSVLGRRHGTLPTTARHSGGDLGNGFTLPPGDHARYHNVYGMLMAQATREGCLDHRPDRRPFVLTRAGYMGSHRVAATWTGDNRSRWEEIRWSITMALNMGLSGQPFVGPDIGGFNDHCDGGLMARWMGIGALLPFARGHAERSTNDKEPWAFGPEVEATCRRAIERRYRLMPYLYTLFEEAHRTGLPVVRPAFFADPADPSLRTAEDVFLLGGDVAVCCRLEPHAEMPAPPPGFSQRFELVDGGLDDPDLPALYLRDGAAIVVSPVVQHTSAEPAGPHRVVASPGADGRAEGVLYEDAGDGFGYRDDAFRRSRFEVATTVASTGEVSTAGEGSHASIFNDSVGVHDVSRDGPQVP